MESQSAQKGNPIHLAPPKWLPKRLHFAWDYAVEIVVEGYLDYWYTIHEHLTSEQIAVLKEQGKFFDTSEWTDEQLLAEAERLLKSYKNTYPAVVNTMKNVLTKHTRIRYPQVIKKEQSFEKHRGVDLAKRYVDETLRFNKYFYPAAESLLKKLRGFYYQIGLLTNALWYDAYPEYSAKHKRIDALFAQFHNSPMIKSINESLGEHTFPDRNDVGFSSGSNVNPEEMMEKIRTYPMLESLIKTPVERWWPQNYPESLAGLRKVGQQIIGWSAITAASSLFQTLMKEFKDELDELDQARKEHRAPWLGIPHGELRPDKTKLPDHLKD